MLNSSLRVIHRTDRHVVTRFGGRLSQQVVVVERLMNHKVIDVRALSGRDADNMLRAIGSNARATFEPGREFTTDNILDPLFS